MSVQPEPFGQRIKRIVFGKHLDVSDSSIFHRLSLIAFFAWVGLGADGLSSSCYGPPEAFLTLGEHSFLAVFVGLGTAVTIFIIASSYSQIIELFPSGGGGYIVASRLLSPTVGMVSGCALLIDYVLTITLSIAAGADAVFSFLPTQWFNYRIEFAIFGVVLLTWLNMRGVKESVIPLVPVFMIFVLTHAFAICYGIIYHLMELPTVTAQIAADVQKANSQLGLWGMIALLLKAYSMGAGTYTGIEAVSNGLPILREPKTKTGRRTMTYMAVSLAVTVVGLMLNYILFDVVNKPGKTINAVLFENITAAWSGTWGYGFVLVTLVSEALLLFVAAQAGFLDGPRVLANMALDRWVPARFALLSDRLVTQNGILLMGGSALLLMIITSGRVDVLIVLYSINVFITFVLSQLGMVRHWWQFRGRVAHWKKKLLVNGLGLILTSFILISVVVVKFDEGGWVTVLVTMTLVVSAIMIRRHYRYTGKLLKKLDVLVESTQKTPLPPLGSLPIEPRPFSARGQTAVILVNGYSGLGLHTLMHLHRLFHRDIQNLIFLQVAVVDAGVFKGPEDIDRLKADINKDLQKYVDLVGKYGYYAEAHIAVGTDVIQEVVNLAPDIIKRYPRAFFVGGQLVFKNDSIIIRLLHNYVTFSLQRALFNEGIPFMILPVRV
ncbi:MAG: APC family permease [Deltaproteobacteria bacterium]|nr:APC family permease [Deltaproteobacteria bacterium]